MIIEEVDRTSPLCFCAAKSRGLSNSRQQTLSEREELGIPG